MKCKRTHLFNFYAPHQCPPLIDETAIEIDTRTEIDHTNHLLTAAVLVLQLIDIAHHPNRKTQIETASAVGGKRRIGTETEIVEEAAKGTGAVQESGRRRDQGERKSGTRTRRSESALLFEHSAESV